MEEAQPPQCLDGVRVGVVVVVVRAGRFLMIRRAAGVIAPHAWCFVGGGIEPGESQVEAVRREFAEEVGVHVEPVRAIWEWRRPDGLLHLHWWLAAYDGAELRLNPLEVAEAGWFTLDEIQGLPAVLESNLEFLQQFAGPLLDQDV